MMIIRYVRQVETSTRDATPGEFLMLHIRNNFITEYIYYMVSYYLYISRQISPVKY